MGLSTTHGCWEGGYVGFAMFREAVGKAAGIPQKPSKFAGNIPDIDWDSVTERQLFGHWDRQSPIVRGSGIYDPPITDPVLYLLVHSDCEGKLRLGYLPVLKARLEEIEPEYERILPKMPAGYHSLTGRLRQFIEGLGAAIEAGEHVEFH